ncbi:MAG: hypothetical protein ACRDJJ_05530 [Actinomycetota bacterium]
MDVQAQRVARIDRTQIASLALVAALSGLLGAGIGVWATDSGGSQSTGVTSSRRDISSSGRSQRALEAESARYEGQAGLYRRLERLDFMRARRAESARWQAAADFYRALNRRP